MRKSLWILPLLFAAISASNAHADEYTPTFTCNGACTSLPNAPITDGTSIDVGVFGHVFGISIQYPDGPFDPWQWAADTLGGAGPDLDLTDDNSGDTYGCTFILFGATCELASVTDPSPPTTSQVHWPSPPLQRLLPSRAPQA